jgi:hypothetical protein
MGRASEGRIARTVGLEVEAEAEAGREHVRPRRQLEDALEADALAADARRAAAALAAVARVAERAHIGGRHAALVANSPCRGAARRHVQRPGRLDAWRVLVVVGVL